MIGMAAAIEYGPLRAAAVTLVWPLAFGRICIRLLLRGRLPNSDTLLLGVCVYLAAIDGHFTRGGA